MAKTVKMVPPGAIHYPRAIRSPPLCPPSPMLRPLRLKQNLMIWLVSSIGFSIAGPFGTIALPLVDRVPYWLAMMGVNTLKWMVWFRLGTRLLGDSPRRQVGWALLGSFIVNLPLPWEVRVMALLLGGTWHIPYWPLYGSAVALGITITAGIAGVLWARQREAAPHRPAENPAETPTFPPATVVEALGVPAPAAAPAPTLEPAGGGLLARAGVADPAQVLAVEAEDHYLRLYLADGRKPLVLYRLRDALAELTPLDGEQVHRGYWVAGRAVRGLERRDGRKWGLRLQTGLLVPVSATFLPMVRKRGWRELDPALET